jgi:uncharacterized protein YggE
VLLAAGTHLAKAQSYPTLLRVEGEMRAKAIPANMEALIPISVKETSYEACSEKLISTYNLLSKAFVKNGLPADGIKSHGLQIQEYFTYTDRERRLDGYQGQITASVQLPHTDDNLNKLLRTLGTEAFRFGYSLQFSLSEKQKETLESAAIEGAVHDARRKAESIATALDMKLVAVHEVNYGTRDAQPGPLTRFEAMKSDAIGSDLQLNPNEQEIFRTVQVVWHMAKP